MPYSKDFEVSLFQRIHRLSGNEFPVDVFAFAKKLAVVEIESRTMAIDGYLAKRTDGQLAIRFRAGACRVRTRFTIAHEIGHILIAAAEGREIHGQVARGGGRSTDEERLANQIAAAILLPEHLLVPQFQRHSPHWGFLHGIASMFDVSIQAAIIRVASLSGLFACNFEIADPGGAVRLNYSKGHRVLLHEPPRKIPKFVLRQVSGFGTGRLNLPLQIDGREIRLPCISRWVDRPEGARLQVVGWTKCGSGANSAK